MDLMIAFDFPRVSGGGYLTAHARKHQSLSLYKA